MGTAPVIDQGKLKALVTAYDAFAKTEKFVVDTLLLAPKGPVS